MGEINKQENKIYNCHYWRVGNPILNFGEHLVQTIIEGLGYSCNYEKKSNECLLSIGSCLDQDTIDKLKQLHDKVIVWGTGYSCGEVPKSSIDIKAVRGPITARLLGVDVPTGDPAFLLPNLTSWEYNPIGRHIFVPHWENWCVSKIDGFESFNIFMTREEFDQVVLDFLSCDFIATNSLHVAIFCICFKIPFAIVLHDKEKLNKPIKWQDVSQWLNTDLKPCSSINDGKKWWNKSGCKIKVPDLMPLLESFPH